MQEIPRGDFNLKDRARPGRPQKFDDEGPQRPLEQSSTQTETELAVQLEVAQLSYLYK